MYYPGNSGRRHTLLVAALTACCLMAMSASSGAALVQVYVLTGQSNSLGTTNDPAEPDYTPGSDPADAATRFFWDNVWNASTSIGDSGGLITTLQQQQGSAPSPSFWGPEMGFGREMYAQGETDIMIVKASRGGGGNTYWSKADGGHMYQHILDTVGAATTQLTSAGDTFEVAGLMYLQGESDSTYEASVSGARLEALINNLRTDLPNASSMHTVIGGIAAPGTDRDVVRAQQSALAAGSPDISYFSNLDLTGGLFDGLHFDKPSKLAIGGRYADAFLNGTPEPYDPEPFQAGAYYRETFANTTPTSDPTHYAMDPAGWQAHHGPAATLVSGPLGDEPVLLFNGDGATAREPVNSNYSEGTTALGRTWHANVDSGQPHLFWTDEYTLTNPSDIGKVFWEQQNNNTVTPNVAVSVGGNWYMTNESGTTIGETGGFEQVILDFGTATWSSVDFTPGSQLSIGTAASLPAGSLEAFGLMIPEFPGGGIYRFDNYTFLPSELPPQPPEPVVRYRETFTNTTESWAMDYAGWQAHHGPTATLVSGPNGDEPVLLNNALGSGAAALEPVNSNSAEGASTSGNTWHADAAVGEPHLFWTDEYTIADKSDIDTVSWEQANTGTNIIPNVAVRIDGNWYMSNETGVKTLDTTWWDLVELDFDAATWSGFDFTPGSELSLGGDTVSLPAGAISAFGLIIPEFPVTWPVDPNSAFRFDNFTISDVEEELHPGDANGDGYVNVSDLGILATNYGTTSGMEWEHGDFTDDGAVNVSDLGILATWYGTVPDAQAVPEPSTLALLIVGSLALLCIKPRRTQQ